MGSEDGSLTKAELKKKYTVALLKEKLQELDLSTSGRKDDLVERYHDALASQEAEEQPAEKQPAAAEDVEMEDATETENVVEPTPTATTTTTTTTTTATTPPPASPTGAAAEVVAEPEQAAAPEPPAVAQQQEDVEMEDVPTTTSTTTSTPPPPPSARVEPPAATNTNTNTNTTTTSNTTISESDDGGLAAAKARALAYLGATAPSLAPSGSSTTGTLTTSSGSGAAAAGATATATGAANGINRRGRDSGNSSSSNKNNNRDSDRPGKKSEEQISKAAAKRRAKRNRKKARKKEARAAAAAGGGSGSGLMSSSAAAAAAATGGQKGKKKSGGAGTADVEIEYVTTDLADELPPEYAGLADAIAKLSGTQANNPAENADGAGGEEGSGAVGGGEEEELVDLLAEQADDEAAQYSRRKLKALKRLSVAELKQLVRRPDVVEAHDVTATDPRLLVHLKSYRNSVPVPRHWSRKRKYLQNKRGIDKIPYRLPDYIEATGVSKVRGAFNEKEGEKTLKQQARDRMHGKLGKLDIDYQVLHDAFFRYQTKPKLTIHGDLYYEGKEFEVDMTDRRPGVLSDELRSALGMPEGAPPPWLINMQRYGPPPSYPDLQIPGLNAPIPHGASFGYHPGGWGKPPVDEYGNPLYGDVFGMAAAAEAAGHSLADGSVEKSHWGTLPDEESESESESESDDDSAADSDDDTGIATGTASTADGSGTAVSTFSGLETPSNIELRKTGDRTPMAPSLGDMDGPDRPLYRVLQQTDASVGSALVGSTHTYVIPGAEGEAAKLPKGKERVDVLSRPRTLEGANVDVTIDASELDKLDESLLKDKYEASVAAAKGQKEDFSDIFAEEAARRARKRKSGRDGEPKGKRFKF